MCSNFIPSAFFPKDIIDYFFDKKDFLKEHKLASEKLWKHGKLVQGKLKLQKMKVAFELTSLNIFLGKGLVHEAITNFEVSLLTRISVVEMMIQYIDSVVLIVEPTPFVFRLIPPNTVIIDVDRNKSSQTIQGIVIENETVFANFQSEFNRLVSVSEKLIDKNVLISELNKAKQTLRNGIKTVINVGELRKTITNN